MASQERKPVVETLATLARHGGRCDCCRGRIFVGDAIQRVDGQWAHEECVPFNAVQKVTVRRV